MSLFISRYVGETIVVGEGPDAVRITVTAIGVQAGIVKFSIDGARHVPVNRLEIYEAAVATGKTVAEATADHKLVKAAKLAVRDAARQKSARRVRPNLPPEVRRARRTHADEPKPAPTQPPAGPLKVSVRRLDAPREGFKALPPGGQANG